MTLLFSREHYRAAAAAFMRGIERRIAAGLDPRVGSSPRFSSAAGMWPSRTGCQHDLQNRLGIAVAQQTYRAYRELLLSDRWRVLAAAGARPQRLLWASTGTKDPAAPDTLYLEALAAPDTVNTIPEKTLLAFADHGTAGGAMAADGADSDTAFASFAKAGVDAEALAARLQHEGAQSFSTSWNDLMAVIADRTRPA